MAAPRGELEHCAGYPALKSLVEMLLPPCFLGWGMWMEYGYTSVRLPFGK